ncbi:MAG: hypothetical protein KHW93_09725, partial [Butyricicoccus pullicaecorum]|nr:hypothetical protein [Butyricicoccus pullicaecorum]
MKIIHAGIKSGIIAAEADIMHLFYHDTTAAQRTIFVVSLCLPLWYNSRKAAIIRLFHDYTIAALKQRFCRNF